MNTKLNCDFHLQITKIMCLTILLSSANSSNAQNTAAEYYSNYQKRVSLEYIDDVYIPKNLTDALNELDRLTEDSEANKLSAETEDLVASKLHFSLGRWMQMHWGLEEGSRLSHHFKEKGLSFPDDMMDLLIRCWHRHLNGKPLNEDELIRSYLVKRKMEHLERIKKDSIIYRGTRIREEHRE